MHEILKASNRSLVHLERVRIIVLNPYTERTLTFESNDCDVTHCIPILFLTFISRFRILLKQVQ